MSTDAHLFQVIIDSLPIHLYWTDKQLRLQGCNALQAKNFGMSVEDALGKTMYDFAKLFGWPQEFVDGINKVHLTVMNTLQHHETEYQVVMLDGIEHTFLNYNYPLVVNGVAEGIVGISLDITELKKAQKELEDQKKLSDIANQVKDEFIENMRHDIRTPLSGIVGNADFLTRIIKDPNIHKYTVDLAKSANALLDFLNDVLEAINLTSDRDRALLERKFSLFDKANHVYLLNLAKCQEKNIELVFDYDKKIPQYLIGDPKRLHRIILELVSNAITFTNKGFVKLKTQLEKEFSDKVIIKIIVEDSGVGIPEESKDLVYFKFKRMTPSYEGKYKGIGMGLTLAKQFITELGGEIHFESSSEGTCFQCILPFKLPLIQDNFGVDKENYKDKVQYREELPQLSMPEPSQSIADLNILLVEDQAIAARIAKSLLNYLNATVDIAENGHQAVEMWEKGNYDLIFMDIGLPDKNGCEVTKEIRAKEKPLNKKTPIIALTAHVDGKSKQTCIDSGMEAVLSKPLTLNAAKDILKAIVPGKFTFTEEDDANAEEEITEDDKEKVIDLEKGSSIMKGDTRLAREMIDMLKTSLEEELPIIKEAYQNQDQVVFAKMIHKVKGGLFYCGVPRLTKVCVALDESIKDKNKTLMETLYKKFIREAELVLAEKNY